MQNLAAPPSRLAVPRWREIVWPREHGSWSLALEPVALGLLAAPTAGGAALAIAAAAGFFARRPLRIALVDAKPDRRRASRRAGLACAAVAFVSCVAAVLAGGPGWLVWLVPSSVGGAIFVYFDVQQSGREQAAEVAGAFTFAWLPAAFGALGGWSAASAAALGLVMVARAVPTVLTVRATIRARKTGEMHAAVPLASALAAATGVVVLARLGLAPWTAAALTAALALRSFVLLAYPRPVLRASTIGISEAVLGVIYVAALALGWPA